MAKIKPLCKKRRFLRWLKRLLGIQSPSARACGFRDIDEMHTYKPKVALIYTEEEAALLYDLLSSEMDELMSMNTKNRLSEKPIFDKEQTEYLHRAMQFCAEQMKVLSKYAPLGGANDAT